MKSLKISEPLWQQVKIQATKNKITINTFVEQALKAELKKQTVADEQSEDKH